MICWSDRALMLVLGVTIGTIIINGILVKIHVYSRYNFFK